MIRIYSILLAFVMDILLGDPYDFPHPVRLIGKFVGWMEKNLRKFFKKKEGLIFAGFLLLVITLFLTFIITFSLIEFANRGGTVLGMIIEAVIIYFTFSLKCLKDEAVKIFNILQTGDIVGSRKALSMIVGRDTQNLSKGEIIRAVVETVAENTVDGFLSPLFYALIGGAPLAMTYKAANTLDSMVGYKNEKYQYLGYFSAKWDDLMNYIPARLSLFFFTFSALLLKLDWRKAFIIGIRDRKNHKSPNCAFSEGAVAGALGIQLGGTNRYFGQSVYKPTIGDKKREIKEKDIITTCQLMIGAGMTSLTIGIWIYYIFLVMGRG